MSAVDSYLNVGAVMVSYDIVQSLQKKEVIDLAQIKIARWATLVLSLLAMILAFHCQISIKIIIFGS